MERQEKDFRSLALEMIDAGVKIADPRESIKDSVSLDGRELSVRGEVFNLNEYDKVLLFGIGKASTPMCQAMEEIVPPDDGLVITKLGEEICLAEVKTVPVVQAYHPEPREVNAKETRKILDMIDAIGKDEKALVFLMVSGGGSSLFSCAPETVSIEEKFKLNQLLMKCGASIHHINTIRKHCSDVKGGKFGQRVAAKGSTLISLILSDVVGDDLSTIASGPSYKDDSTFEDAISLLKHYKIWEETPLSIRNHMESGLKDSTMEPPREIPERVHNFLIGSNLAALEAAKSVSQKAGINTHILTSQNHGEAKSIAKCIMGMAREIQDSGNPFDAPVCLIMGGEMIVTFDWEDRNGFGPTREFVLSSAIEIAGRKNIVVAGCDTDGVDGDGKSGAIADGQTISRSSLDAQTHLDKHNAEAFFDHLDDSIQFTSMTNVNDIVIVLIDKP